MERFFPHAAHLDRAAAPSAGARARGLAAVLLDRDGVLNRDRGYVARAEDFEFLPGAIEALRSMAEAGYRLIVITNQSGIGRGYYCEADFAQLNTWMLDQLRRQGVTLAGVYHCPHAPEAGCDCRKPQPGMIWQAAGEHQLDLARCWLVGDKPSDIQAGRRAGVGHTVLVRSGQPLPATHEADHLCDALADVPALLSAHEALL